MKVYFMLADGGQLIEIEPAAYRRFQDFSDALDERIRQYDDMAGRGHPYDHVFFIGVTIDGRDGHIPTEFPGLPGLWLAAHLIEAGYDPAPSLEAVDGDASDDAVMYMEKWRQLTPR